VATVGFAAGSDFYLSLLQRGISHVKTGNFDAAAKELRIAAFGLVDSIPQFEIAEVYLTIASEKLDREADARHAAQRLLAAERIEPHYTALNLPDDARADFERIVLHILTSDQVAVLHARGSATPPAPINPQPVAPIVIQPAPTPTPVPKSPAPIVPPPSRSPAPITTQPVAPIHVAPSPQPQPQPQPRVVAPPPTATPQPQPQPVVITPPPRAAAPQPQPAKITNVPKALSDADAALANDDLGSARVIYRALVDTSGLDHATLLRVAEGSYRARDFATAVRAFNRLGMLQNGEEPYHYYLAVALYETGHYKEAKRELDGALPFIQVTPDVARYRAKIEGAIE
jgi:tetratricopeptide (TPR) repeat protein